MYERCSHVDCNKKLKLTDMSCRCEKTFCGLHRHAETHNCTFDYKSYGREVLSKIVIGCVKEKVEGFTTKN
jgi:hypothetical protein